jgi:hypothetical protein
MATSERGNQNDQNEDEQAKGETMKAATTKPKRSVTNSIEAWRGIIDHPKHYTLGGIEVIDAIEAWSLGFHLGNVVKYIARSAHKGSRVEDLKKGRWYLDREIRRIERKRK